MIDSKLIGVSGDITNFIPRVETLDNHSVLSTRDSRGGVSFSSWKSTIKMINSNSEQSHLRWVAWDAQWRQTIGRVAVGCCFSLGEITKKYPVLQLRTPYRPTQSVMYVPLQVNTLHENILLIVQYKYLKSCSGDFYSPESDPPHKIMRYCFYYSIWLGFSFPPDHAGLVEMICTTVVPVTKGHLGGASP